jgi:hypothetical protein
MASSMTEAGEGAKKDLIKVQVTFPVSKKGPYRAEDPPETTVGAVRMAATSWFEVSDDGQFVYVLTYAGLDQPNERTIGEVAEHAHGVEFKLVKKITQGA